MNVQVLLATMHSEDLSVLEKMNVQTDIIVANQCDENKVFETEFRERTVKWYSFAERGVGLNRNNALMRATGDICLFADDDVVYVDGYEDIIRNFYEKHPDADVVIFNMITSRIGDQQEVEIVKKEKKLGKKGVTSFGTFCVSVKTESIRFANIFFHLQFGGCARYSCGEDTIFLQDCVKHKLKVYASKDMIGKVYHQHSTWFNGYTDKYFEDKGILFYCLYPKTYKLIALYHAFKHRKLYKDYGWYKAYKKMGMAKKRLKAGYKSK